MRRVSRFFPPRGGTPPVFAPKFIIHPGDPFVKGQPPETRHFRVYSAAPVSSLLSSTGALNAEASAAIASGDSEELAGAVGAISTLV